MKTYLILIVILFSSFGKIERYTPAHKIKGVLLNYHNQDPIVFAIISLSINKEKIISTMSDFDGKFVINLEQEIKNKDSVELEIEYAGNFKKQYKIDIHNKPDLTYTLKVDSNLTKDDIIEWRKSYSLRFRECGTKGYDEEEEWIFEKE